MKPEKAPAKWNRSTAIGLAQMGCVYCRGNGTRIIRHGREVPCNCVFRVAFRACLNRFRECSANGAHTGSVVLDRPRAINAHRTYSRKNEEYMADFCLVSKRALEDDSYKLFRCHFLLGADWRLCCRQLKIDRGSFFHAVYRIEQLLGRTFAELKPYPLWPLDEYFGGRSDTATPLLADTPDEQHVSQVFPDRLFGPSKRSEGHADEKALAAGAALPTA